MTDNATQAQDVPATENDTQNSAEETKVAGVGDAGADQVDSNAEEPKDDDHSDDEGDKPKRKSGTERLKQRLAVQAAEIEALKRRNETVPTTNSDDIDAAIIKRIGEPPREQDFGGDYLAFSDEMTAWRTAKLLARSEVTRELETRKVSAEVSRQEKRIEYEEREHDARKRIPDYDQVLRSAGDVHFVDYVRDMIIESNKSADLVYYIAQNTGLIPELNSLSEREAARRIGAIEARLGTVKPKTQTSAPAPITSLRGGASQQSTDARLDAWLDRTYGKK